MTKQTVFIQNIWIKSHTYLNQLSHLFQLKLIIILSSYKQTAIPLLKLNSTQEHEIYVGSFELMAVSALRLAGIFIVSVFSSEIFKNEQEIKYKQDK